MKITAEFITAPNLLEFRGHFFNLKLGLTSYVALLREFDCDISGVVAAMDDYKSFLKIAKTLIDEAIEVEAEHGGEYRVITIEELGKAIAERPHFAVILQTAVIAAFRASLGERSEAELDGERELLAAIEGEEFEQEQPETESSFDYDLLYFLFKTRLGMADDEIKHMTIKKAAKLIDLLSERGGGANGR